MSYEICYRSMNIRMRSGKMIPMDEVGSNNCYEFTGRGMRRERSWANHWLFFKNQLTYTREEIESIVDDFLATASDLDCYTVYGKGYRTTKQQLKNHFMRGCDRAVTFDFLNEYGVSVYVCWYDQDNKHQEEKVTTEEALVVAVEEHAGSYVIYRGVDDYTYKMTGKNKERKPSEPLQEGYVIRFNYGYVLKVTSRHLKYTYGVSGAHVYRTKKQAEAAMEKISRRFSVGDLCVEHVKRNPVNDRFEQAA